MALPASMALPPPNPMTKPHFSARANRAPRTTRSMIGSPEMENEAEEMPLSSSNASNGRARSTPLPVTTSARSPNSLATNPTSRSAPAPKMIRVAVANSKRIVLLPRCTHTASAARKALPAGIVRKYVGEFHARARFGHHRRHGIAPFGVMRSLFVCRRRVRVAIDFDEHETVWVVRVLDDIKAGNARFLDAVARVLECGLPERLDALRFHMNLDMDDQHDLFSTQPTRNASQDLASSNLPQVGAPLPRRTAMQPPPNQDIALDSSRFPPCRLARSVERSAHL